MLARFESLKNKNTEIQRVKFTVDKRTPSRLLQLPEWGVLTKKNRALSHHLSFELLFFFSTEREILAQCYWLSIDEIDRFDSAYLIRNALIINSRVEIMMKPCYVGGR